MNRYDLPLGNAVLERVLQNGLALRVLRLVYIYRKGFKARSGWRTFFTRPLRSPELLDHRG